MTKLRASAYEALRDVVADGMTIAVGGFGLSGNPFGLIDALRDTGARDLTIVSNNMGTDGFGLGILLESKQVRRVIASYVGENKLFARQYLDGEIEVDLTPQGTLAERLRAGGAGIPAFYTPTGFGTPAAEGKPTAEFDGKHCVLERAIVADIGLVHAHTADAEGNLRYRYTSQNFNPLAAMSGRTTIVEAEVILPDGSYIEPDSVMTPGIFVHRIVQADPERKPIEKHTVRQPAASRRRRPDMWTRDEMAAIAARDLRDGEYVNLGIGIPTLVANHLPPGVRLILHSENGLLGMGEFPLAGEEDADLINAGKQTVTIAPGGSCFDSATSFAMIRGGHIGTAISRRDGGVGRRRPRQLVDPRQGRQGHGRRDGPGRGARRVLVITEHVAKDGTPKIVAECSLPLTGRGVVDRIITNLAVFDVTDAGLVLTAMPADGDVDKLRECTGAPFKVADDLQTL